MVTYIQNFIFAYVATIGFAILFNTPKSALLKAGFGGAVGWLLYSFINFKSDNIVLATFIASFFIALIGEIFAITNKKPITVFIIPGIVPLVPGFGIYFTMLSILEKNYTKAAQYGSEALLISISIAGALTIVLTLNSYRKKKQPIKIK
ncbi:threonine/serine exporter [Alkaliphilus pronyensis]|uniref:Threonine/serine exporter n=1 Tax=Alkaliphilus pronyensis TaxID=1482732 RepID=A0A6I0FDH5_9FIRM|nr:threonine/serine exporter family protein [Alkaliphilus pronyensis]KAB3537287.1 threonine/serine exporter [Alkaliphilus pronyensis]